jgi:hypothetical protein
LLIGGGSCQAALPSSIGGSSIAEISGMAWPNAVQVAPNTGVCNEKIIIY